MNLTITPNLFHFVRNNNLQQNTQSTPKYHNLTPLAKDTISFGVGEKQLKSGHRLSKQFGMEIASTLKQPFKMFTNKLENAFSTMKATDNHPDRPIYRIKTRIKSAESIAEKGGAREVKNFAELTQKIQDMIGGRLIMRDTSKESIEAVLKKFEDMVLKGELSITEIENFYGAPKLAYATDKQLSPLINACEKMIGPIRYSTEKHPMGYNAIHMTVKFPPTKYGETYAEIQIMGSDIAALKDVEDLTYKIRCGKAIQSKYKPMMKYLKPLQDGDETLKNTFADYTRQAYLHQRRRKSVTLKELNEQTAPEFFPLPWYISNKELDFNFLYQKMKECEAAATKKQSEVKSVRANKGNKVAENTQGKNTIKKQTATVSASKVKKTNKQTYDVKENFTPLLENFDQII